MLENEKTGGTWSENSTVLSQNGAFLAASGLFDPKNQAAGSYRFRYEFAQNGPCPASFAEVEIVIFDAPTASAGADQTISCQNPTVEIGIVSGQTNLVFEWKNAAGAVVSTAEKATISDAGFYFLEVKNAAGCSARDTVEVKNDGSKPTAAIASSAPFLSCDFLTATLDATASLPSTVVFEWFLNQNSISTASKIDVSAGGIYRLVVTDPTNGCTDEAVFDLKEDKTTPILTFFPVDLLDCAVQQVTVEVDPSPAGVVFSFVWAGPQIVAGFDAATVTVAAAGQYSVTVTNETTGCTATGVTEVFENTAAAAANAGPDATLDCLLLTVQIGSPALAGQTYLWSNGATTAQIQVSASGLFSVTATNALSGCTATDTVLIDEKLDKPTAKILPSATVLTCAVDEIELDASGSTGQNPLVFSWFLDQNALSTGQKLAVSAAGCYRLEVVDATNGCRGATEFCVLENKILPFAEASASNDLTCKLKNATLSLAGSTASSGSFLADWSGPNGFASILFSPQVSAGGAYFLTITDTENGCTSTATATVGEIGQVAFPFEVLTKNPTCAGDCDGSVRLENPAIAGLEVAFENGDFGSKTAFSGLCSGLFDLKVRDSNGCEWVEKRELLEPEKVTVALGPDVFLKLGDSTEVVASASPSAVRLEWSDAILSCFDDTFCTSFWARPFENRLYRVTVFDANGCSATDDIFLQVDRSVDVFAPNVFAPESAENGQFSLFFGPSVASIESFQIFDRWGEKVFESLDFLPSEAQNLGWDGRFRGDLARPNVFVWFCKFTLADGRERLLKGDLTLVR